MSFIKIYVHCVWATKRHYPFLTEENLLKIVDHIHETAKRKDIYIDFINGHKNHLHCLVSMNPRQNIADIMQQIKGESSFWVNKEMNLPIKFEWADEYFAVSVSESGLEKVRDYIKFQQKHHANKTWEQEYSEFMTKYGFYKGQG